ncbi:MAG TPA: ABC transporter substrate-binding protein [Candidatus Dormibacteraeota bacterium]|nr:ABC transporter substrate-binding protein [Candidatus Dormibacteraeota bacterium]
MRGVLLVGAVALVVAACGGGSSSSGSKTASSTGGAAPSSIKSAGKIVYCSDITYPPEEYYKGTTPAGSDIDIGTTVAQRMGVKAEFDNTGFDGIIAALESKKCDAIISGMSDTPERRKQIDFVEYMNVGQTLMANKAHTQRVSSLMDLSGKSVAMETGTTELALLQATNKKLKAAGKPPIQIQSFPKDTDAANALKTGKVDFYFGDSPVVINYTRLDPKDFTLGSPQFAVVPVAIGMRKDDPELRTAVKAAITKMYANHSMCTILGKWRMQAFALPPHKC